ncbi:hypothetical protein LCGC14_1560300, partial [marine sediment metagenome]
MIRRKKDSEGEEDYRRRRHIGLGVLVAILVVVVLGVVVGAGVNIWAIRTTGEVVLAEIAAGLTPDANFVHMYAKADGKVYSKDDGGAEYDLTAGAAGAQDLQDTYDNETAPVLVTLTDALGGIIFEGDAETTDPALTIRDSTSGKVGILLDNDDEVAGEASPLLRLANSTAGAGDTQFSLVVTTSDALEIQGDDDAADLTISSTGEVTFTNNLTTSG